MSDQRHDGCIEPAGRKRKGHRRRPGETRPRATSSGAGESELPLRRVNALNLRRRASLDQQLREGPVAAADVDPSQARKRHQPIEEDLAGEPAQIPIICS